MAWATPYDIISFIGQNCRDVSLQTLSDHFAYTPNHISRLIRQKTGKTFVQIANQARLLRAASDLTATTAPIDDIAQATGFGSAAYFIRCFRREYGVTPTEYRRAHAGKAR